MSAKLKRIFIITLLLSLLLIAFPPAIAAGETGTSALDTYLAEQARANRLPGLVAAVVENGKVVFLKGYGVDPQAQFVLGSTTKSFTALAAMQLVEAGKLELDAPVQKYLPWFRVADSEASGRITVRHLLNQTSGLSTVLDPGAEKFYPTLEEQVRALSDASLAAEPGQKYQYFNQNYRVLGLLIEQASGQSYPDYLREHIFQPLRMDSTVADPAGAPRMAPAYTQVFSFPVRAVQPFHPDALPSGYLISTATDSARYLAALMAGGELEGRRIIAPDTLEQMLTPPASVDSTYGMGWMVIKDEGLGGNAYYHNGSLDYFSSDFLMIPGKNLGLVLLYNQNGLFQMLTVHEQVLQGAVQVLLGETPTSGGTSWEGLALAGVVLLDLLNHLRLFLRLPHWADRTAKRPAWLRVTLAGLEILFPLAILTYLPGLVASALGEAGGWADFFSILPDVAGWIIAGSLLTLIRGLVKVYFLARGRQVLAQV